MDRKRNILITGASGFIGGFLVEEALRRNYNIYVVVRKSTNTNQLKTKSLNIVEIDFANKAKVNQIISSLPLFDYIIHNAGATRVLKSKDFFEVNFIYTKNVINALKETHKIPSKFLFVSSMAASGPGKNKLPISFDDVPNPVTEYGRSKLASEQFIKNEKELPYLIIKPTAVYGPRDKDFFQTIRLINKGIDLKIGKLPQILTFIFVKDFAKLIFDALESPYLNKTYLITDGNLYNSKDLGSYVSQRLNKKAKTISVPIWMAKVFAAFSVLTSKFSKNPSILRVDKIAELAATNWNCDINLSISDLKFKAEYNLEMGINETIDWYKQTKWLR